MSMLGFVRSGRDRCTDVIHGVTMKVEEEMVLDESCCCATGLPSVLILQRRVAASAKIRPTFRLMSLYNGFMTIVTLMPFAAFKG